MEEVEPPFADESPEMQPTKAKKSRAPRAVKNPTALKNLDSDPAAPKVYNSVAEALGPAIAAALKNPKPAAKNPKPTPGSKMDPEWFDLWLVMSDTGNALIKSLLARKDIPEDALRLLEAILCLRESKDLFFAQGERLTAYSALFWADELKEWAANADGHT